MLICPNLHVFGIKTARLTRREQWTYGTTVFICVRGILEQLRTILNSYNTHYIRFTRTIANKSNYK